MNNLLNKLQEALDRCEMKRHRAPTLIKLTSDFANYLAAKCPYEIVFTKDDSPRGYTSSIFSIPFEIDNTIEDPLYEIVYEEN